MRHSLHDGCGYIRRRARAAPRTAAAAASGSGARCPRSRAAGEGEGSEGEGERIRNFRKPRRRADDTVAEAEPAGTSKERGERISQRHLPRCSSAARPRMSGPRVSSAGPRWAARRGASTCAARAAARRRGARRAAGERGRQRGGGGWRRRGRGGRTFSFARSTREAGWSAGLATGSACGRGGGGGISGCFRIGGGARAAGRRLTGSS
jgi:hypothetical protein